MFFKNKWRLLGIIFISVMSLVSCSRYIGGQKKQEKVIELSENQFTCLKDLSPILKRYANGTGSDSEVISGLNCLQSATTYFVEKTQGTTFEEYSIEDLRKFFGKYFLKQNNLSQELTFEVMKLKKALLGGADRSITKTELRKLVSLIDVLKTELVSIRVNVEILTFQSRNDASTSEVIDESTKKLNRSLKMILSRTSLMGSDYKFEDGFAFIQGMADYFKDSQVESSASNRLVWLPLLKDLKVIFFGQNAYFKNQTDWNLAIDTLTDIWNISLIYKHKISHFDFDKPNDLDQVFEWSLKFLNLVESSSRMKSEGEISFSDIDIFIKRAYQLKIINSNISVDNILKTYQIALIRFFNSTKSKDLRAVNSLNRNMIRALRFEIKNWGLVQSWINNLSPSSFLKQSLVASFKNYKFNYYLKKYSANAMESDQLYLGKEDFLKILEMDRIPFLGKDLKVHVRFRGDEAKELIDRKQLTYFHAIHTFSRLFLIGYGDGSQINVHNMRQWYTDFSLLGIEMKVFDPRSTGTPERSFQEANFFTFHGNGNQWVDLVEVHELITLLIGSGYKAKSDLREFLKECETPKLDIFDKKWIIESCFKNQFQNNFQTVFSHLPNLQKAALEMTPSEFDWFYYYLVSAARGSDRNNGLIEDSDLRSLMVIINYIEVLISTYDFDHSGDLSIPELEQASLRFKEFFKAIKPSIDTDDKVKKVFTYLVINGEKPSESTAGAIWDFSMFWLDQQFGASDKAGRLEISKVFYILKKDLMKQ